MVLGNVKVQIPKVQCKLVNWFSCDGGVVLSFSKPQEQEGALNKKALARKAKKKG